MRRPDSDLLIPQAAQRRLERTSTGSFFVLKSLDDFLACRDCIKDFPLFRFGGGSLIGSLMPHPPHEESKANEAAATPAREQRVWTLRDGQLLAVPVKIGETDGKSTEISDGELKPGMDVVVDVLTAKP